MEEGVKARGILLGKMKPKDISDGRIAALLNQNKRIVMYQRADNEIQIFHNPHYKLEIETKLKNLSPFMFLFEGIQGIHHDFQINILKYDKMFAKTKDLIDSAKSSNDSLKRFYEKGIIDGELELEGFKDYPEYKQETEEKVNNLLIDIFDKEKRLYHLEQLKEYERERARKIADARRKIEVGTKNLKFLQDFEEIFRENDIQIVEELAEKIMNKENLLLAYIDSVKAQGNLLEAETVPDKAKLIKKTDKSVQHFDVFKGNFMKLYGIKRRVVYLNKAIELNTKIGEMEVKIAAEEGAAPFLKSIDEWIEKKLKNVEEAITTFKLSDTLTHMQNGVAILNQNLSNLNRGINSLRIGGGFSVNSDSITHDLHVKKPHVELDPFALENIPVGNLRQQADQQRQLIKIKLDRVIDEEKLLTIYNEKLALLKKEYENNERNRDNKINKKNKDLENISNSYKQLSQTVKSGNHVFIPESLFALFGMLYQHFSLRVNRFFMSGGGKSFTKTEIKPIEVYDSV